MGIDLIAHRSRSTCRRHCRAKRFCQGLSDHSASNPFIGLPIANRLLADYPEGGNTSCTKKGTIVYMSAKRVPARFYQTEAGNEPVREWLKQFNLLERKIVGTDIKTVEYGWTIGMPNCRYMGKGLYEVRSNLPGGKIDRVFFCIFENHMILLHGFIKKTQKTPAKELDLALKRKSILETKR